MDPSELYEADFLLWTEQQAAAIRALPRGSNSLDLTNLAEEIESLGRSELNSVVGHISQLLLHLLKIAGDPTAEAVAHWRAEALAFRRNAARRYSKSMGQRIDIHRLWADAVLDYEEARNGLTAAKAPSRLAECPFRLDDLLADDFALDAAIETVAAWALPPASRH